MEEWGQRQPRQACLAGLCSERARSFMECTFATARQDYLLSQSPSLPADRRAAWYSSLVSHQVQIQFVWHGSIQMPEDCWQFSFSGNKTATSTPAARPCEAVQSLFQGRVPSLRRSVRLFVCVWILQIYLLPLYLHQTCHFIQLCLMILIFLSEENTGNEIVIFSPSPSPALKCMFYILFFHSSVVTGQFLLCNHKEVHRSWDS